MKMIELTESGIALANEPESGFCLSREEELMRTFAGIIRDGSWISSEEISKRIARTIDKCERLDRKPVDAN